MTEQMTLEEARKELRLDLTSSAIVNAAVIKEAYAKLIRRYPVGPRADRLTQAYQILSMPEEAYLSLLTEQLNDISWLRDFFGASLNELGEKKRSLGDELIIAVQRSDEDKGDNYDDDDDDDFDLEKAFEEILRRGGF